MTARPFAGMSLDRPLSVADIARALDISPQRARRFLLGLEARHPGTLMRNPGVRTHYTITLRALRRVMPRVGLEPDGETLTNLQERVQSLENKLKRLAAVLAYTRPKASEQRR